MSIKLLISEVEDDDDEPEEYDEDDDSEENGGRCDEIDYEIIILKHNVNLLNLGLAEVYNDGLDDDENDDDFEADENEDDDEDDLAEEEEGDDEGLFVHLTLNINH